MSCWRKCIDGVSSSFNMKLEAHFLISISFTKVYCLPMEYLNKSVFTQISKKFSRRKLVQS